MDQSNESRSLKKVKWTKASSYVCSYKRTVILGHAKKTNPKSCFNSVQQLMIKKKKKSTVYGTASSLWEQGEETKWRLENSVVFPF